MDVDKIADQTTELVVVCLHDGVLDAAAVHAVIEAALERARCAIVDELTDLVICQQDTIATLMTDNARLTRRLEWALRLRPVPQTWEERYGMGERTK